MRLATKRSILSKKLTNRESKFINEYLIDLDVPRAALAAGFSKTIAKSKAYQWVSNSKVKPHVFAELKRRILKQEERTGITADYVLSNIKEVAEKCLQRQKGNKFDSSGANKALELLGRHLKLFTDKIEHLGEVKMMPTITVDGKKLEFKVGNDINKRQ